MSGPAPARLHALLARDSRAAVVIRRGPAKSVCTVLWDRHKDTFTLGQWMRGRIYERRCDISPDGRYFIYFALNGKWDTQAKGSWTAISRVPYLKALTLYPKGDAWGGGGLFTSRNRYWLNGHCLDPDEEIAASTELERDQDWQPQARFGGECPSVYYHRLQRDGWTLLGNQAPRYVGDTTVFEKPLPHGWILRKWAQAGMFAKPGRGCYWDEHELENTESKTILSHPAWEWAEYDPETIVFAQAGRLYRMSFRDKTSFQEPKLLHDFKAMQFEAVAAPY